MLQDAQDVNVIANYPWLLAPVGFIMLAVVLFNFVGDGIHRIAILWWARTATGSDGASRCAATSAAPCAGR